MSSTRSLALLSLVLCLTSCTGTPPRHAAVDPCAHLSYDACADYWAAHEAQSAALSGQDPSARYVTVRQMWCVRAAGKIQDQAQQSTSVQQCYRTWQHVTVVPDQPVLNGQR